MHNNETPQLKYFQQNNYFHIDYNLQKDRKINFK